VTETEVRVEPFFQRDRLDYVRVVDYGLTGILRDVAPERQATAKVQPPGDDG